MNTEISTKYFSFILSLSSVKIVSVFVIHAHTYINVSVCVCVKVCDLVLRVLHSCSQDCGFDSNTSTA